MRPTEHTEDNLRLARPLPAEVQLAASRALIEKMLNPGPDSFPRSQTMRLLSGGNAKVVVIGAFAALIAVKPRLAMSLVRFLPLAGLGPIGRILERLR